MERAFYIEHLGCAKNRVDAEKMSVSLVESGWRSVENAEAAELIIVNSCGFIEPAKEESIATTLELAERYPDKRIVLSGCLSERYGESLSKSLTEIDGVFGNRDPAKIDEFIESGTRFLAPKSNNIAPGSGSAVVGARTSYLKISEGCNNRCSFCAIPLIRGDLRSRDGAAILNDFDRLLDEGVFEINLIAQDIASYGSDRNRDTESQSPFLSLIEGMLERSGVFWLRMLYLHPDHFPLPIFDLLKSDPRLLPYFDIPFQHASKRLLQSMGRRGSSDIYLGLLEKIRSEIPDAVIRSTFLLGYPGERRSDYETLLEFQKEAQIEWLGTFLYSPEEGTRAYRNHRKLTSRIARTTGAHTRNQRRRDEIELRQESISSARLERFVGSSLPVLIEEPLDKSNLAIGRAYLNAPEVDGNVVVHGEALSPGELVTCRIIKLNGIDLEAIVVP